MSNSVKIRLQQVKNCTLALENLEYLLSKLDTKINADPELLVKYHNGIKQFMTGVQSLLAAMKVYSDILPDNKATEVEQNWLIGYHRLLDISKLDQKQLLNKIKTF